MFEAPLDGKSIVAFLEYDLLLLLSLSVILKVSIADLTAQLLSLKCSFLDFV